MTPPSQKPQEVSFLELLKSFNRKERFHLLSDVLNDPFNLSEDYRCRLQCAINVTVPNSAWVAMDYHLDWISVAVKLFQDKNSAGNCGKLDNSNNKLFRANQQDIDLVIAFEVATITNLVLVEAKAYEAKWEKNQLSRKLDRLREIFEPPVEGIHPYLVLTSPRRGENWVRTRLKKDQAMFGTFSSSTYYMALDLAPRFKITRGEVGSSTIECQELESKSE